MSDGSSGAGGVQPLWNLSGESTAETGSERGIEPFPPLTQGGDAAPVDHRWGVRVDPRGERKSLTELLSDLRAGKLYMRGQ